MTKKYVTKDSGARAAFDSGMVRDTSTDKARFDLLIPLDQPYEEQILTRWANLMARGAKKYAARNWELADGENEYHRFKESLLRHVMQYLCDDDSEDHAAAILFNVMGAEFVKWKLSATSEKAAVTSNLIGQRFIGVAEPAIIDELVEIIGINHLAITYKYGNRYNSLPLSMRIEEFFDCFSPASEFEPLDD